MPGPSTPHDDSFRPEVADYELLRVIGEGSYGQVWLARGATGAFRAIKVVQRGEADGGRGFARAFKGLRHYEPISREDDNLMDILHVGPVKPSAYFYSVMELADDAVGEEEKGGKGEEGKRSASEGGFASAIPTEALPGSTGDPPVPVGEPPGGREARFRADRAGLLAIRRSEIPVGESPTGTGASPVLPKTGSHALLDPATYVPRTLRLVLDRCERLPVVECVDLGIALCRALEVLHGHGLVHRDVKPSNIVFVQGRPKLADIDLVTPVEATVTKVVTEGFTPPEGSGTQSADLYSLGKVLYESSTGNDRTRFPVPPLDLSPDDESMWADLNDVLLRACDLIPSKRYSSAKKMHQDLLFVRAGKSPKRLRILERRAKQLIGFAAAAVAVAAIWLTIQQSRTAVAQTKAKLAEEREQEQRRQVLIQQIQVTRLSAHEDGWSDQVWKATTEAAAIRKDANLQSQATASLAGLDVRPIRRFTNYSASSVAFDPRGKRLIMGGTSQGAQVWNCDTDEITSSALVKSGPVAFGDEDTPLHFVFQNHGSFLLWDAARNKPVRTFTMDDLPAAGSWPELVAVPMAIAENGSRVAAAACFADGNGRYVAWDARSGQLLMEGTAKVFSLAFTPDGLLLAAGDNDGNITIWSLPKAEKIAVLKDDRLSVRSLAFHRDPIQLAGNGSEKAGWLLAAGDEGGTVRLWDLTEQTVRMRFVGSPMHIYTVAFSSDGALLASAGRYAATLWDVATGKLLLRLGFHDFQTSLAFSPDGRRLVVAAKAVWDYKGSVVVYELEDGHGIRTLRGLAGQVTRVWISGGQKWIAAVGHNWRLGIWEMASGRLHRVIEVTCRLAPRSNRTVEKHHIERVILWPTVPFQPVHDLKRRSATLEIQEAELDLLARFNRKHQQARSEDSRLAARIRSFETAFGMQNTMPEVLDFSKETDATLRLYGLERDSTKGFAWQCLVARRMAERGVRFVELIDSGSVNNWDSHGKMEEHVPRAKNVDQAIAGLLTDLKLRGMLHDTLVVFTTEFGRTPHTDGPTGRSHHPHVFSSWLAGGGVKGGMVYGESDDYGYDVAKDLVHAHDFHATILHLLGLDHERLTYRYAGRDFRLTDVHGNIVKPILA